MSYYLFKLNLKKNSNGFYKARSAYNQLIRACKINNANNANNANH